MNSLILLLIVFLFACTASPRYNSGNIKKNSNFKVKSNKSTYSKHKKTYKGVASWYGPNFHGKLTANGEVYDQYGVTAAHKELPLNTIARVTNLDNDKSIILRINDRGPYAKNRILDCSYGAAKKLDFLNQGTANVKIEIIEFGDNEYMHHN
jgi:rare lipoprotein A